MACHRDSSDGLYRKATWSRFERKDSVWGGRASSAQIFPCQLGFCFSKPTLPTKLHFASKGSNHTFTLTNIYLEFPEGEKQCMWGFRVGKLGKGLPFLHLPCCFPAQNVHPPKAVFLYKEWPPEFMVKVGVSGPLESQWNPCHIYAFAQMWWGRRSAKWWQLIVMWMPFLSWLLLQWWGARFVPPPRRYSLCVTDIISLR